MESSTTRRLFGEIEAEGAIDAKFEGFLMVPESTIIGFQVDSAGAKGQLEIGENTLEFSYNGRLEPFKLPKGKYPLRLTYRDTAGPHYLRVSMILPK